MIGVHYYTAPKSYIYIIIVIIEILWKNANHKERHTVMEVAPVREWVWTKFRKH